MDDEIELFLLVCVIISFYLMCDIDNDKNCSR